MLSQTLYFSSISLPPLGTKHTKQLKMSIHHFIYLFLFFSLSSFHVSQAAITTTTQQHFKTNINPFTPKASLIRYWNTHVSNKHPIPHFLLSKASPLTPQHYAILNNLLTNNPFSSQSHYSLCTIPNLFCSFDQNTPQLFSDATKDNANFAVYSNKHFGNYGSSRVSGTDSFKNYSNGLNTINDSFKKYSTSSTHHGNQFSNYAENGNVANANFTSYGSGATAVSGGFDNYDKFGNVPNLRFTTYDSAATDHKLSFSSYGNETNAGTQSFTSYGKRVRGGTSEFTNYAVSTNILQSGFTSYGELGTKASNDSFKFYSSSGNNPQSNFQTYGAGSISGTDSFTSYRNSANVGSDSFQSYAAKSNSGTATFTNYGKSFNLGNDSFKEYGKGSKGHSTFEFKSYDLGRDFKEYNKQGASFSQYHNFTPSSGKIVNKLIEEGKFFRESMLKEGKIIIMPDINDKMPQRSFLPLSISSKLPFSTSRLTDIKEMFQVHEGSATERVILNALRECERNPSIGETKRCVGSAEGMINFAVSVLGPSVMVRTTESVNGSKKSVITGRVISVNNGKVTKSVSCHQSLYPHLLYYCHSVPKVRVYEVDILDMDTKVKINHGVAICHLDTSSWGPQHGAFLALGSRPGKIEVCHWIFQNDMTWTIGSF